MAQFATVIKYQFENEPVSTVILDTVDDTNVTSSTTVTQQPVVSGDEISDHQFKLPKTLSINGICSMNGSQGIIVDGTGSKLANFQELFERIQNEGVLCDIYKIIINNEKDIRFKQRNNMVLESIRWTERINSLGFSLSFRQVLIADVVEYDVDIDDAFAPNVTEPTTTSFTNTLIDWSEIDAAIVQILKKESLITPDFLNYIASFSEEQWKGIGVGAAIGAILVGSLAVKISAGAAAATVGSIIGGAAIGGVIGLAVGALVLIGIGIAKKIKQAKKRKKYAVEQFRLYQNSSKNEKEAERFADFIYEIHEDLESINDLLHIYQISTNEAQEAMISVGDDYYIFTFTKNNTTGKYSLSIENTDKSKTSEMSNVEAAPTDVSQITSSNYLVKAKNNARIYLLCPDENKSDLTNYFIVVCDFNPDDFNKLITDIISNHIYRNAGG